MTALGHWKWAPSPFPAFKNAGCAGCTWVCRCMRRRSKTYSERRALDTPCWGGPPARKSQLRAGRCRQGISARLLLTCLDQGTGLPFPFGSNPRESMRMRIHRPAPACAAGRARPRHLDPDLVSVAVVHGISGDVYVEVVRPRNINCN